MFKNAVNGVQKFVCRLSQLDELLKVILQVDFEKLYKIEMIMEYAKKEDAQLHKLLQKLIAEFNKINRTNLLYLFGDEQQYDTVHCSVIESANYLEHHFGIHLAELWHNPTEFGEINLKIVPLINLARNHLIRDGQKQQQQQQQQQQKKKKRTEDSGKERKKEDGRKDEQKRTVPTEEGTNGTGINGILDNWSNLAGGKDKRRRRRKKSDSSFADFFGPGFYTVLALCLLTYLLSFIPRLINRNGQSLANPSQPLLRNSAEQQRNETRHTRRAAAATRSSMAASSSTTASSSTATRRSSMAASSSTAMHSSSEKRRITLFNTLPTRIVSESESCPICLSEFEADSEIKQLSSCNHNFHTTCMELWLLQKDECPVCRAKIFKTENGTVKLNYQRIHGTFNS
ncbi:hypothetical protein niasHT_039853 [Heterodera trifolii]|uniref:RING-type domain-containing protein n=1 Tax=Heterodera trifolii TaxID=157864 RepID=A0ABD2IQ81_9BILA